MEPETFLNGKVQLLRGDCMDVLPTLAERSFDSVVTDPPYALVSIAKRFGNGGAMDLVMAGPDEKRHAIIKRKGKVESAGPLFCGLEAAE